MGLYRRMRQLAGMAADAPRRIEGLQARLGNMAAAIASVQTGVAALASRPDRGSPQMERDLNAMRRSVVALLAASCGGRPADDRPLADPTGNPSRDEVFAGLARRYPKAYPLWQRLFDNGLRTYLDNPDENLSTEQHAVAPRFKDYVTRFALGRVLDIGCGPQPLPYYLAGLDLTRVAAVDPLDPLAPHPFAFRYGVGEAIPWPDASFETVITATSLDHVISLRDSLAEIGRIISDGGRLIVWVGFIPGGTEFDPEQENPSGADEFHLFHFDEAWMEDVFETYFVLEDRTRIDPNQSFYVYRKIAAVTR